MKKFWTIFAMAGFLLATAVAWAETDVETQLQYLSDNTMSPFCPGLTLSACPSPQAGELRGEMKNWLEAGYSVEGVRNQLRMRFGDAVLGAPRAEGVGLLIWIIPAFFVLLGLVWIARTLRRPLAEAQSAVNTEPLNPRVNEELRRRLLGE